MTQWIYGYHAVQTVLRVRPEIVKKICVARQNDARWQTLQQTAKQADIAIEQVSLATLIEQIGTEVKTHQGIAAACQAGPIYREADLAELLETAESPLTLLILDGVQDPHNLGACLRTANAFGVTAVIAPKDRAVGITPVVRKVACGAADVLPFIAVTNLARTLRELQQQGIWLVGATANADVSLKNIDLTGHIGLVMGSEGQGMRALTAKHCDFLARIDINDTVIDSLNVSVATGVMLYEIARQR